jgi:diguanylate cyclase (GGDEF)-like protein/PAS domain S-box-containing protein
MGAFPPQWLRRPAPMATINADALDHEFQSSLVRAIHEASPDGILVVDDQGIIVSHNRRFVDLLQIPASHLRGSEPDTAIGSSDDPILAAVLERVKDREPFLARVRELYANPQMDDHSEIEMKDGRTLERHSTLLRGRDGQYLGRVWFFRDMTAQKSNESALQELARHDPLTGIANRRYFFELAHQEFARAKRNRAPLCIAELDVDHFKRINDQFGHAAGDEMLKALCQGSQHLIRETELFARMGGEEFVVLLPDTRVDGAQQFAERLRAAVARRKLTVGGKEIGCTISIGVASLRSADTQIEDCLRRADDALYRAKEGGRNRVEVEA